MACIYVDSPGIRSKIVGQSEQTIADLFSKARSAAPCKRIYNGRYPIDGPT
jgi:SpoVK/Ycf46/Vps4 family AAA+-type ATPase